MERFTRIAMEESLCREWGITDQLGSWYVRAYVIRLCYIVHVFVDFMCVYVCLFIYMCCWFYFFFINIFIFIIPLYSYPFRKSPVTTTPWLLPLTCAMRPQTHTCHSSLIAGKPSHPFMEFIGVHYSPSSSRSSLPSVRIHMHKFIRCTLPINSLLIW